MQDGGRELSKASSVIQLSTWNTTRLILCRQLLIISSLLRGFPHDSEANPSASAPSFGVYVHVAVASMVFSRHGVFCAALPMSEVTLNADCTLDCLQSYAVNRVSHPDSRKWHQRRLLCHHRRFRRNRCHAADTVAASIWSPPQPSPPPLDEFFSFAIRAILLGVTWKQLPFPTGYL